MPKATRKSRQHSLGAVPSTGAAAARPCSEAPMDWPMTDLRDANGSCLTFVAFAHEDGALEVVRVGSYVNGGIAVYRRRDDGRRPSEVVEVWSVDLLDRVAGAGEVCLV